MSNTFFQFKQFTVNQDKCAMKVSTDACIQGAWTPIAGNVKHVLDIGTGTGLLSLMLAQRNPGIYIDAIELDESAAIQAKENIESSPWRDRMNVIHADIREYTFDKKYDLVICNPPFFQNSLLGPDAGRNNVRHNTTLSFHDLLKVMLATLAPGGYGSILLPSAEMEIWGNLAENAGLSIFNKLLISPNKNSGANRVVSLFSVPGENKIADNTDLIIYAASNEYTVGFSDLMAPFYLKL